MLPREKLEKHGIESLEDYELIALLLETGSKELNVFDLSRNLLDEVISLKDFLEYDIAMLMRIKGIKKAKASKLLASFELARRIIECKSTKVKVEFPNEIYKYIRPYYIGKTREECIVLYLNNKSEIIAKKVVSLGDHSRLEIDTKLAIKYAINYQSNNLILIHNHPEGSLVPSKSDLDSTNVLKRQLSMFDLHLLDHIIVTDDGFFSFAENNHL